MSLEIVLKILILYYNMFSMKTEQKNAFIFSFDAFVATTIIFFSIQYLILLSYTPSANFYSLRQAQLLAHDVVEVISLLDKENNTQIIASAIKGNPLNLLIYSNLLIPPQYDFSYDFYDFSTNTWKNIVQGVRKRNFEKISASSSILVIVLVDPIVAGDSPYCNVACKGYDPASRKSTYPPQKCIQVPCSLKSGSTYDSGNMKIGLLRLTLWG